MSRNNGIRQNSMLSVFLLAVLLVAGTLTAAVSSGLSRRGAISGIVLEGRSGDPIPLVEIQIWNERGEYREATLTDMSGAFLVSDLEPGRYFASTMESGFRDELWSGRTCPIGECDPTAGTPIEVSADAVTIDVDFHLER